MGNMLTKKDPYLNLWQWTFNSHNKVLTEQIPTLEETVNSYNSTDNLTGVAHKDASGVTQASESYTPNSYGLTTDFYDANSHHYVYGYDTNGTLNSVTTPLGNKTQFVADALGNRTSRTDALARQTAYTLDAWERCTTITYPDQSTKTYSFDADSDLTGWTDRTGTYARSYDNCDRLTGETFGGSTVVSYSYDGTGQKGLLSSTTDSGGRVISYTYTVRNELHTAAETAGTVTYTYDACGNETGITNENSTTVTRTFDNASRLTGVTNKNSSATVLSSFSISPDTDNRVQSVTEADGSVVNYGYDYESRLTSETRTGTNPYSKSYTLDGVGNRTSQSVGGVSTTFTLDSDDQLNATSGGIVNSYSYNANGEQTGRTLSGTAYTLAYDYDGQLTSITQGSNVTSFAYDGLGRRYSRTAGGTTTAFQFDGEQVLLEKQGSTTAATYTYGNALVRKDAEYPMFDGLGLERTVTNSSQTVTGTVNYDAFGQTVGTTGSSSNPYMFAATSRYRNDGDTGLMLVGARYYDAQVGRFITRDTDLDEHPYLYCEHDPVNAVDPSGHFAWLVGLLFTPGIGQVAIASGLAIVGTYLIVKGIEAIGTGISEYRSYSPKNEKDKPWVKQGQYRGGPHYDPAPDGKHGGPHIDIPDSRDKSVNHRYPMPGNRKEK